MMRLLKLNFRKELLLFLFLSCCYGIAFAQTNGVIVDSKTLLPIPFVSIYTKGKDVQGTMGDESGKYSVDFDYDTIYFSHVNYALTPLVKNSEGDTIRMSPTIHIMPDVVITVRDNKWIEELMKQIVENKSKNYLQKEAEFNYSFEIKSLSDSSGYAFNSYGYMLSPQYSQKEAYRICPISNVVKYKDETAGKDFMQLRRSVYNKFINDFDKGFIKKHDFSLTSYSDEGNENLLQFTFKSKKEENRGYIVVDTLKKAIVEFEQKAGTDYNVKSNTSAFTRMTFSKMKGVNYTTWETVIRGQYSLIDDSYYLTDCRYQFYQQHEHKEGKENKTSFANIESRLTMSPNELELTGCDWLKLPAPRYMTIIYSKSMRLEDEALEQVPTEYEFF